MSFSNIRENFFDKIRNITCKILLSIIMNKKRECTEIYKSTFSNNINEKTVRRSVVG